MSIKNKLRGTPIKRHSLVFEPDKLMLVPPSADIVQGSHPFVDLRTNPHLVGILPELAADEDFTALVQSINNPEGPLFSFGCEKLKQEIQERYKTSGYVQFAFTDARCQDPMQYCEIYERFESWISRARERKSFFSQWALRPAKFRTSAIEGHVMIMRISTDLSFAKSEADIQWAQVLQALRKYFTTLELDNA